MHARCCDTGTKYRRLLSVVTAGVDWLFIRVRRGESLC
jgi:hypothetical protein